jgi:hypothetical protein
MAMIRVMVGESDHRKWTRENSTASELMRHIFGTDALPISVYRVNAGIEEARAVAAHYLTLARQSFKSVSALRIELQDHTGLEIAIRETPGDTGIAEIDAKHCELTGGQEGFAGLTQRLLDAIRRGEDRVRIIGEIQLKHQVQEFLTLGGDAVNDRARRYCRKLLGCSG